MDKRILALIAVIMALLLLWWYLIPSMTVVESGWTNIGNPVQQQTKLIESNVGVDSVLWDNCAEGSIKVEFEYEWEFYDDDWTPLNDCCDNPVSWEVRDSLGSLVYDSESCSPIGNFGDSFEITDGVWDCIRPWRVTVVNGCLFPINYRWDMTMWSFE